MKAFALASDDVASAWDIRLVSATIEHTPEEIAQRVVPQGEATPEVIGFSTYVWNYQLVHEVLTTLHERLPQTVFILGGVEVMNRGSQVLRHGMDRVLVCNGEGEKTFKELLRCISFESADYESVGGISFLDEDGSLITTEPYERIKTLDEVPSPFLLDYFSQEDLATALLETNRGCPYHCSYCFWGGAVGQKIHRIGKDRVMDEIQYLAHRQCRSILVCDANFGIFPVDTEYAQSFVEAKREHGFPLRVRYSSAKNNLERSLKIAVTLAEGGVLTCQPISLQTLSPEALSNANRDNIDQETYFALQAKTNELGVPSFIELIWPLPGETLDSFKSGLATLIERGAQALAVYPLLWLNNVGFEGREEELGVQTRAQEDRAGSGVSVVSTAEVPFEDYIRGLMYAAAIQLLHDARCLAVTMEYLNNAGICSIRTLCELFVEYMEAQAVRGGSGMARRWDEGRRAFEETGSNITWPGSLVYEALHVDRPTMDSLLRDFVTEHAAHFTAREGSNVDVGADVDLALTAFLEFDLLCRPYVYRNTPRIVPADLTELRVVEDSEGGILVESPLDVEAELEAIRCSNSSGAPWRPALRPTRYRFDYSVNQGYHIAVKAAEDHFDECRLFATEAGNYKGTWYRADEATPAVVDRAPE